MISVPGKGGRSLAEPQSGFGLNFSSAQEQVFESYFAPWFKARRAGLIVPSLAAM
ncbi:hypothetical protein [Lysobacter capsici]|uniref:hypothetical protein n=1 Tax=Lysobacter capsici TaxID=435897 RepID=UPI001BFFF99C|nr:hypothetical protein [Lysobacter capsici]QWF16938.1 hypothetical protein KME82_24945 [Lysobacter capsici]